MKIFSIIDFNFKLLLSIIITIYILLVSSCNDIKIHGIWMDEFNSYNLALILESENDYDLKLNKNDYWSRCSKVDKDLFGKGTKKIKIISPDRIKIITENIEGTYKRQKKSNLQPSSWIFRKGMSKETIHELFVEPDTILFSKAGSEKWFFKNGIVMIFIENGLFKITENYKKERKFLLIKKGMYREAVIRLIGVPDRTKSKAEYESLYYGLENKVILKEGIVTEIIFK